MKRVSTHPLAFYLERKTNEEGLGGGLIPG